MSAGGTIQQNGTNRSQNTPRSREKLESSSCGQVAGAPRETRTISERSQLSREPPAGGRTDADVGSGNQKDCSHFEDTGGHSEEGGKILVRRQQALGHPTGHQLVAPQQGHGRELKEGVYLVI